jgi:two-component system, NarL family, sensor kinase
MLDQEEIVFGLIIGTFLFLFLSICLLSFFILFKNSKKRYKEEKKNMELAYKNELANINIEIQENTLEYISRELHDNVGQLLTVAKIHLNSLSKYPEKRTDQKIIETSGIIDMAVSELKLLTKTLNPEKINQIGLISALELEIERIKKLEVIATSFIIEGENFNLGADKEIILFRIVQEFIANSIKYSEATDLKLLLKYTADKFELNISDNGKGFNINDTSNNGSGIANIKSRANLIKAECNFSSNLNNGTILQIFFKYQTESNTDIADL